MTELDSIEDGSFDIVYTGGHVAVWVSDLTAYYGEAIRILRTHGLLLINEYHPFRRLWNDSETALELQFGYFEQGPHRYDASERLFDDSRGEVAQYEFH